MQNQSFSPRICVVVCAVVKRATVVKYNGTRRHRARDQIRQSDPIGFGYVVYRTIRILFNFKYAVFVGCGHITHTAIVFGCFIQSNPGGYQIILGLNAKIALILVQGFGLAPRWFEQHLIPENFDTGSNEAAHKIKQQSLFCEGSKNWIKPD